MELLYAAGATSTSTLNALFYIMPWLMNLLAGSSKFLFNNFNPILSALQIFVGYERDAPFIFSFVAW